MSRTGTILLLALLILPIAFTAAYTSPGQPTGFVNDRADILTPEEEATLESKLTNLAESEGSEISIVTLLSLDGDTIENVAVSLFAEWGIGKKGADNGVLLLIAMTEREMRIEVGYGLEGTITDAQAYWIVRDILTPAFKNNDYFGGLSGAVDKITEAITGSAILPAAEEPASEEIPWTWPIVLIFYAVVAFLSKSRSFWFGGVAGFIIGFTVGTIFSSTGAGFALGTFLGLLGLIIDYIVSRGGGGGGSNFRIGGGSSGGGGFGGFGGGRSGGGGASGRW